MKYHIYTVYEDRFGNKEYRKEVEEGWHSAYGKFITNVSDGDCVSCKVIYLDSTDKEKKIVLAYQVPEV